MERINISYKRTKKNDIYRTPNEIYMNDTVDCRFGCCGEINPRIKEYILRSKDFYVLSDEFINDYIYYIEEQALTNIIITETAIIELKRKYIHTFRRLERIIDRHNIPVISDIYSKRIYEIFLGSKVPDFYRAVCIWYREHIPNSLFTPVYSDKEIEGDRTVDMLPRDMFVFGHVPLVPAIRIKSTAQHTPYKTQEEIEEISDRIEIGGISVGDRYSSGEIVCNIDGNQMRIEIPQEHMNRAVDRDYVIVEVLEETEDKSIGRVVGIERRNRKPFPCTIKEQIDAEHILLEPEIENLPTVIARVSGNTDIVRLKDKIILAVIEEWLEDEEYPYAHIIRETGEKGTIEAETASLLAYYSIIDQNFEEEALNELPDEKWTVSERDILEREDLRDYPIASIDPEGCIDIDDALHAIRRPGGTIEIGVHIADVTHFVTEGSNLDREGRIRGCTTYLPNRRIDMLPSLLGTNLCSLHKNVDRLAFSVIWEIDIKNDQIIFKNKRFTKSVIRSKESFTYDQASYALESGKYRSKDLLESLRILKETSVLLKAARLREGAFVIHSDECRITARNTKYFEEIAENPNDHIITEDEHSEKYDTHSLVEEFMLLANQEVASYISSVYPRESLIRIHPKPAAQAFKQLEYALSVLSSSSVVLNPNNPSDLSMTLKEYSNTPELKSAIGAWATRCMTQAVYAPSSVSSTLHYGLAMNNYTHFTSPIRRYADVIVHRILYNALNNERYSPVTKKRLEDICDSVNRSYRSAKWVARHANNLYVRYLIKGVQIRMVITQITPEKTEVYIPYYGVTGILKKENTEKDKKKKIELFSVVTGYLIPDIKRIFAFKLDE